MKESVNIKNATHGKQKTKAQEREIKIGRE